MWQTWNLKITMEMKRNIIFQTSNFWVPSCSIYCILGCTKCTTSYFQLSTSVGTMCGARPFTPSVQALDLMSSLHKAVFLVSNIALYNCITLKMPMPERQEAYCTKMYEVEGAKELKKERHSMKALFDSPFLCKAFCYT